MTALTRPVRQHRMRASTTVPQLPVTWQTAPAAAPKHSQPSRLHLPLPEQARLMPLARHVRSPASQPSMRAGCAALKHKPLSTNASVSKL